MSSLSGGLPSRSEHAKNHNGQQGDVWDAHKDMFLATLASISAAMIGFLTVPILKSPNFRAFCLPNFTVHFCFDVWVLLQTKDRLFASFELMAIIFDQNKDIFRKQQNGN